MRGQLEMVLDPTRADGRSGVARREWLPKRHPLVVNQMALGSYRQGFLTALETAADDIEFLVGDEHFEPGVRTDVSSQLVRSTGRNVFLLGRRAGWQRGCLRRGLWARTLVVELNPRNLTSWVLLGVRAAAGLPTAGWGHAHSRRGSGPEFNRTRRRMQRMCSYLIAYTDTESAELAELFPDRAVKPARNSLYSRSELSQYPIPGFTERRDLIIIGRLVPDKKALLGVRAFAQAAARLPVDVVLHVIGSGPQERAVVDEVARAGLGGRVRIHGQVSDVRRLAPVFQNCRALLAPGYIGLNAVQALGFGVPVLYSRDEPHSPEIEALDASNSVSFPTDDVEGSARAIVGLFDGTPSFDPVGIAESARARYSTDTMIDPFVELRGGA